MEHHPPTLPPRRTFWLQWSLAHLVAWIVGMGLTWLLSTLTQPLLSGFLTIIFWAVSGAFVGFCFAVNHWIMFRPILARFAGNWRGAWFTGTVLGWAISLAIIAGTDLSSRQGYALSGLIVGIAVGLPQWLALRRHIDRAWIWIAGHTVSWVVSFATIDLIGGSAGFVSTGLISGVLTGGLLIYLLGFVKSGEITAAGWEE